MINGISADLPQSSDLLIKQNDKFFSRLLSKEASVSNSSFRVYYGGASGAIPFLWESQPGTPKNKFCDTALPPLTPPPSYQLNSKSNSMKKASKFKLIHTIFPRINVRKTHVSPSSYISSSSSSSRSSSMSSPPSTPTNSSKHRRHPSSLSSSDSRGCDDEEPSFGSPTSTLCFGCEGSRSGGFKGCYSLMNMKNPFSSSFGNGSRGGTARKYST